MVKQGDANSQRPSISKPSFEYSNKKKTKEEQEVANLPDNVSKNNSQKPTAKELLDQINRKIEIEKLANKFAKAPKPLETAKISVDLSDDIGQRELDEEEMLKEMEESPLI